MTMHHPKLDDLVRRDPRYAYEAYEFLFAALAHTQRLLGRVPPPEGPTPEADYHVSGPELLEGVRDLAQREFGLMARIVFRMWGINRTDDFGELVFNLVEAGLMSKTEEDSRKDFHAVYDLDEALVRGYRIESGAEEAEGTS
jgi:uncharacterized repeat protein (TIGR04138 family)